MLFQLQDYIEAIGVQFGYLQGKAPADPAMNNGSMNLEQMMQQMPIADSVKQ
jgi:hypothetical protein